MSLSACKKPSQIALLDLLGMVVASVLAVTYAFWLEGLHGLKLHAVDVAQPLLLEPEAYIAYT